MSDVDHLQESCAIELRVRLPRELAAEAEEVQKRDPDVLSRILQYGLMRREIYRSLSTSGFERG